jgi:hypothetical protein
MFPSFARQYARPTSPEMEPNMYIALDRATSPRTPTHIMTPKVVTTVQCLGALDHISATDARHWHLANALSVLHEFKV